MEDILNSEKSYDSLPSLSAAACLRLPGIGRNQNIDMMHQCRSSKHFFSRKTACHLLPVKLVVKNPPAMRETWIRSLGWEDPLEKGKATYSQYSGLESSTDCIFPGVTDSDTTERLSGEGNGNSLQYLCLENPMDWSDFHFSIATRA